MPDDRFAFFDPKKSTAARLSSRESLDPAKPRAMSVSALLAGVKGALAGAYPGSVTVVGEISNFKFHSSGHMYFRLKDANAAVDVAMFKGRAGKLKFTPADGMEVLLVGRVDVYEVRGQLQLYAERMEPCGQGALELAFRQLCDKLRAEGLFDPSLKKPIPKFPRSVGVITSLTGAALRDIRRTLRRRWPGIAAYVVGSLVQGPGAAGQIASAIKSLDASAADYEIDVIIVARGGGSIEDLWAFNEEPVARAIYNAQTPIISGVGHETDTTIADMVADLRAATPTAAAEQAVPDAADVRRYADELADRMTRRMRDSVSSARQAIEAVGRSVVFRDPMSSVRTRIQRIDELSLRARGALGELLAGARADLAGPVNRLAGLHPVHQAAAARARLDQSQHRLTWSLGSRAKQTGDQLNEMLRRLQACSPVHRIALARQQIDAAARQLEAMSYRAVLGRGFSVTRDSDGNILRSKDAAIAGQTITTELSDGKLTSVVGNTGVKRKKTPPPSDEGTLFD
ncbi:MAG: exodeoxyribonuclease VII large subunit [Phycisphaerales bacterium]|jgi:exodeoxyribonuclease VII large subunit|nr:exodeoxyribonuclease VII large subunit [Phycisphaerales bacterium]